jgi:hypothetical protein
MADYADFLIKQHILIHYRNGAKEVHLLLDDPDCQVQSPKYFEQLRGDQTNPVSEDHCCTSFSSDMVPPPKWRENILNCRKLVCFLSVYFLETEIIPTAKYFTAGGLEGPYKNHSLFVPFNQNPKSDPCLQCNAEESDTQIWLHIVNSSGNRKLILSPDTDVYHIDLSVIGQTNLNVIVSN